jgi:hypothetical protein
VVTVALAFVGGLLSAALGREPRRRDWRDQARDWRDRGYEMGNQARSVAPDLRKSAGEAGRYVAQSARENPVSGLLIAGAVGGLLGYLLRNRST